MQLNRTDITSMKWSEDKTCKVLNHIKDNKKNNFSIILFLHYPFPWKSTLSLGNTIYGEEKINFTSRVVLGHFLTALFTLAKEILNNKLHFETLIKVVVFLELPGLVLQLPQQRLKNTLSCYGWKNK